MGAERVAQTGKPVVLSTGMASKEEIEVTRVGTEVLVRVRDAHRRVALPASIEGRAIDRVHFADGVLEPCINPAVALVDRCASDTQTGLPALGYGETAGYPGRPITSK